MPESPSKPQPNPLQLIGGIGGAIIGVAVGQYSGLNLLIPMGCAFLVGSVAWKTCDEAKKPMVPAFALQAGHGLWMAFGLLMLGTLNLNLVDLAVLLVGLTWLLLRPGLAPVLLLSIYQAVGLVVNVTAFLNVPFGSLAHKALVVHLIFRAAAILSMCAGLYRISRQPTAAPTAGGVEDDLISAGPQSATPKPTSRRLYFSLGTLLGCLALCAIAYSWVALRMRQANREREAAATIGRAGGRVGWSKQSGPEWLQSLLGNGFNRSVIVVVLRGTRVTDAELQSLKNLNQLQSLDLGRTHVTDAGLENVADLTQLSNLDLENVWITDAGLEHIKRLTELEVLNLRGTHVTDHGLENLRGLARLKTLLLENSGTTEQGVKTLQKALPKCGIFRERHLTKLG